MSQDQLQLNSPSGSSLSGGRKDRMQVDRTVSGSPSSHDEGKPLVLLPEEEKTPSSDRVSTPRAPPAPTKSASPFHGRAHPSPAVRSLTSIFNGCGGAADRARQMGGQYMKVRKTPPKQAGAEPLTSDPPGAAVRAASPPLSSTTHAPKRCRSVLGELLLSPSGSDPAEHARLTATADSAAGMYAPESSAPCSLTSPLTAVKPAVPCVPPPFISPPPPHPTPINLQPRPVTTILAASTSSPAEVGQYEREPLDPVAQGRAGAGKGISLCTARRSEGPRLAEPAGGAPRRAVGRPVWRHEAGQAGGSGRGGAPAGAFTSSGWMKSAAFKPR